MATRKVKVGTKMLDLLSEGDNNKVVALSTKECAKLYKLGSLEAKEEHKKLSFANRINNLLVKAIKLQYSDCYEYEMLVMERLQVLEYRSFSLNERKEMLIRFEQQLKQLHKEGFAHGDIKRPATKQKGGYWDNIICTQGQIKLIDAGISTLRDQPLFERTVAMDLQDLEEFKQEFLVP